MRKVGNIDIWPDQNQTRGRATPETSTGSLRGHPFLPKAKSVHPNNRASEVNQDVWIVKGKGEVKPGLQGTGTRIWLTGRGGKKEKSERCQELKEEKSSSERPG